MDKSKKREILRRRRHTHLRRRLTGTAERPRLCIHRSNKNMYAQVVDDVAGRTLFGSSTLSPGLRTETPNGATVEASARLGDAIGQKCLEMGITKLVFDRAGYPFHGRVKALADAARKRFADAGAEGF